MAGANGLEIDEIGNQLILDGAKAAAAKDGDDSGTDNGIMVDPKEVAKGGEDKKEEPKLDKDGKPIPDPEDYEPYIPEEPKVEPKPKDEPAKTSAPEEKADPDETDAFAAELKADGYDDDTIKMMRKAVKLGGDLALKKMQEQQEETKAKDDQATAEQTAERAEYRRREFVAVGTLQKDGRIPKVPVDIQKKLAEGATLTDEETKQPGVQRQFEVWNHMAKTNQEAIARGEAPYLTGFRAALSDLEATEARAGKVSKLKAENHQRHDVAKKLEVGSAGGDGKPKKPAYIRGQGLDEIAQGIIEEYRAT